MDLNTLIVFFSMNSLLRYELGFNWILTITLGFLTAFLYVSIIRRMINAKNPWFGIASLIITFTPAAVFCFFMTLEFFKKPFGFEEYATATIVSIIGGIINIGITVTFMQESEQRLAKNIKAKQIIESEKERNL